jgi:hypothetical protein
MSRLILTFAALALITTTNFATSTSASADTWGCSYEKCLAVCTKAGGKYCSTYCSKELKDKQQAKTCK